MHNRLRRGEEGWINEQTDISQKGEYCMANNRIKRYLASLLIRQVHIKRYYFAKTFLAHILKCDDTKCLRKCKSLGSLLLSWWKCKMMEQFYKVVWYYLLKLTIHIVFVL